MGLENVVGKRPDREPKRKGPLPNEGFEPLDSIPENFGYKPLTPRPLIDNETRKKIKSMCVYPLNTREGQRALRFLRGDTHMIRPIDFDSDESSQYLALLRMFGSHFAQIYRKNDHGEIETLGREGFIRYLTKKDEKGKPKRQAYCAVNIFGEVLGFAVLANYLTTNHQHDYFIERLVVIPEMQGEKNEASTGKSFLRMLINRFYDESLEENPTLRADVVQFVDNYTNVNYLFGEELKFDHGQWSDDQIDVYIKGTEMVRRPTQRFYTRRRKWVADEALLVRDFDNKREKLGLNLINDMTRRIKLDPEEETRESKIITIFRRKRNK